MPVFRVEINVREAHAPRSAYAALCGRLRGAGLAGLLSVRPSRLFLLEGDLSLADAERIAREMLADSVAELAGVSGEGDAPPAIVGGLSIEVHPRPGVMDPVAESTLTELRAEGYAIDQVRTARRYVLDGELDETDAAAAAARVLANDCIEEVVLGTTGARPAARPPVRPFELRHVSVGQLDDDGLAKLSRDAHLFLSLAEMRAIKSYFAELKRDPTDLELETLAQTWSEHCGHKTLKSAVTYRGAPMGCAVDDEAEEVEITYDNLLKDTIVRATEELIAERRGPECLSVFVDNAGVIGFDEDLGVAFKVETHNHPSAIEPYGGAATGVGGCVRDVMGCGLGARPIANTDVFCVAPSDWPSDRLPKGVLHPRRVLEGVVGGVADYGNRMGIPTVNGAVCFDPRYLGNPLVYCGCAGIIPRDKIDKAARPGDLILLLGGRTGRDGIHGATFSSAELTDTHADEFSHAVQIGNAITEKRCLDAMLEARDHSDGCLYSAVTDCGAGGLSSAVGEMGEQVGAVVDLETVPLKYAGLCYDEIWISEAQERMVLAVPPENLEHCLEIMRAEEVEATVIGTFGHDIDGAPGLLTRYDGQTVGELDMRFLHHGLPKRELVAEWRGDTKRRQSDEATERRGGEGALDRLKDVLASPNIASKEWVIRRYDHEVQGGSVVKPLGGPGDGPNDAAVLRPRLDSMRGVAIGCGVAAQLADIDPYWSAAASIDEAIRNVVCVGGDPSRTAILDNFCWGNCDDPRRMGTLVRACQACYDAAKAYGAPFISGKDSLNNEFALHEADVGPLLETMRAYADRESSDGAHTPEIFDAIARRIRETRRLSIPGTLLISAVSLIDDVRRCVTADLKHPGAAIYLVVGLPQIGYALDHAADIHRAVAAAIDAGFIDACHDCGEGGWLAAVAEMAIAGDKGAELAPTGGAERDPFAATCAGYVVETGDPGGLARAARAGDCPCTRLGVVGDTRILTWDNASLPLDEARACWRS